MRPRTLETEYKKRRFIEWLERKDKVDIPTQFLAERFGLSNFIILRLLKENNFKPYRALLNRRELC